MFSTSWSRWGHHSQRDIRVEPTDAPIKKKVYNIFLDWHNSGATLVAHIVTDGVVCFSHLFLFSPCKLFCCEFCVSCVKPPGCAVSVASSWNAQICILGCHGMKDLPTPSVSRSSKLFSACLLRILSLLVVFLVFFPPFHFHCSI